MKKHIRLFYLLTAIIIISFLPIAWGFVKNIINRNYHSPIIDTISDHPLDSITLDFYIWHDEKTYIEDVIDAYCALHSSVKINLHVIDSRIYNDEIDDLLGGASKIDLFEVRGISKLVKFHDENHLLDLTAYIKNNDMDITAYGSMFNDISIKNKYYGIPTRSTCWELYYNKDIFDHAGIDYPGQMTWDEYRALAIKLTKGEGEDKIYGGYWAAWCGNFAALQSSSYLIDDDLSYTRKSLELSNCFYNIDKSHMSYNQIIDQDIDYCKLFESGKIAMMPQGEWLINMLMQDQQQGLTDVDWDIAPMPILEGQEAGVTWGQYQFVGIAADSQYPEEAFDFIQFLCGEEGARIYAQNGIIHAYSNEEIEQIYRNAVGKDSVSIFFNSRKIQEELAISGYEDITKSFSEMAEEYYLGNKSLDETMSDIIAMRNEILSNSR